MLLNELMALPNPTRYCLQFFKAYSMFQLIKCFIFHQELIFQQLTVGLPSFNLSYHQILMSVHKQGRHFTLILQGCFLEQASTQSNHPSRYQLASESVVQCDSCSLSHPTNVYSMLVSYFTLVCLPSPILHFLVKMCLDEGQTIIYLIYIDPFSSRLIPCICIGLALQMHLFRCLEKFDSTAQIQG